MVGASVLPEEGEEVGGCWAAPGVGIYDAEDPLVVDGEEPVSVGISGLGSGGFVR